MSEAVNLEMSVRPGARPTYAVELRLDQPASATSSRLGPEGMTMSLLPHELDKFALRHQEYAARLTAAVFADGDLVSAFSQACAAAEALDVDLRLRLHFHPGTEELQQVRWELLCDPLTGAPLAASERTLFSRYVENRSLEPVALTSQPERPRVLAAVAAPHDLGSMGLDPPNRAGELAPVIDAFGDDVDVVSEPVNLQSIFAALGPQHAVLYLVCHGKYAAGEPHLLLETESGETDLQVSTRAVTDRFSGARHRPLVVVLAACDSARSDPQSPHVALAPSIVASGVPAVVAMQGKVSAKTLDRFMPVFLRELCDHGEVDRAVSTARAAIQDRPDHWMPTLYMRLVEGAIWHDPGFDESADTLGAWNALVGAFDDEACTAIVGPGLLESLVGSRRSMAESWAEAYEFPLSPDQAAVPHRVAEYIKATSGSHQPNVDYRRALRRRVLERYGDAIPSSLWSRKAWFADQIDEALRIATADRFGEEESPYRLLARLHLPLYVVAEPTDTLRHAILDEGYAEPLPPVLCPWNEGLAGIARTEPVIERGDYSPERPLIYHLLGHLGVEDSIPFSEDDYFDFLIGITRHRDLMPGSVLASLTSTTLLFIGFDIDDREFRVILRFLMTGENRELIKRRRHVAAQLQPQLGRVRDARLARRFFDKYLSQEHIEIYWGSADDFLAELTQRVGASVAGV